MNPDDHYSSCRTGQVFKPFDIKPFFDSRIAPEPGHSCFHQSQPERNKVFIDHLAPGKRCHLGKAQFDISNSNPFPAFQKGSGYFSKARAQNM